MTGCDANPRVPLHSFEPKPGEITWFVVVEIKGTSEESQAARLLFMALQPPLSVLFHGASLVPWEGRNCSAP